VRHILLLITVLLSTICGALALSAQTTLSLDGFQSDPEASVEMLADRLTVSQTDGAARFEGNVVIAQGDMRLSAALVDVTYLEAGEIGLLSASGGVLLVSKTDSAQATVRIMILQDANCGCGVMCCSTRVRSACPLIF
jgi:lipopolysaccharide export system protein LptA